MLEKLFDHFLFGFFATAGYVAFNYLFSLIH